MRRTLPLLVASLLLLAGALVSTGPVQAATQIWTYSGSSGATQITALGSTIRSDLTAASNLTGSSVPDQKSTTVAGVEVAGLLKVGAATSSQVASAHGDGVQIASNTKVAGINLLGGAIQADAIESSAVASGDSTGVRGSSGTTFLRLTIGGRSLAATVAPNTRITIPGIADVVVNETRIAKSDPGRTVIVQSTALHVTLLKAAGGAPVGAEIKLMPAQAIVVPTGPNDALPVGGFAYGAFAGAKVGSQVKVYAEPTGILSLPSIGTGGKPYPNTTLAVNVPNVITADVVSNVVQATTVPGFADVDDSSQIAHINLLGGLVTADGIRVRAHVRKAGTASVTEASTEFINLKVAGKVIPVNAKPNTIIDVLGVARVIVNWQNVQPGYSSVVGVRILLSTQRLGIPAGADVQLGTAASWVVGY